MNSFNIHKYLLLLKVFFNSILGLKLIKNEQKIKIIVFGYSYQYNGK